jgi:hypothetical protein
MINNLVENPEPGLVTGVTNFPLTRSIHSGFHVFTCGAEWGFEIRGVFLRAFSETLPAA